MGGRGDLGKIQGRSIDLVRAQCSGVLEEKGRREGGKEVEVRGARVRTNEGESYGCLVGSDKGD